MSYQKELDVGIQACLIAAKLCERVRSEIPQSIEKPDQSPVTLADFGSQAIICYRIRSEFPNDSIVAEENPKELLKPERSSSLQKVVDYVSEQIDEVDPTKLIEWIQYGNGKVSERYWTLDPIDGTKGFLRQDQYAIALALIVDGQVKVGVLACPALGEDGGQLLYAVRGEGAHCRSIQNFAQSTPTRIHTLTDPNNEQFRFTESVETAHANHELQRRIATRIGIEHPPIRVDSQAKYALVARGEAALYLRLPNIKTKNYRENIWDHAAGSIVVEEAGGKVTDIHGKPLNFRDDEKMLDNIGVVVSNGFIHQQVLESLRDESQTE